MRRFICTDCDETMPCFHQTESVEYPPDTCLYDTGKCVWKEISISEEKEED